LKEELIRLNVKLRGETEENNGVKRELMEQQEANKVK
jgi:hypothetical protein